MKRSVELKRLYAITDRTNEFIAREVVELLMEAAFVSGKQAQLKGQIKGVKNVIRQLSGGRNGAGRKRKKVSTKTE